MKQDQFPKCPNCGVYMTPIKSKTASGFGSPRTDIVQFECPRCKRRESVQFNLEPSKVEQTPAQSNTKPRKD